jgi:hypothetical protein
MNMPKQKYCIQIETGQRVRAVDEATRVIVELGGISRKATTNKLVRIADGLFIVVTAPWLALHLARHIFFAKSGRPIDPPSWLVQAVLASAGELPVPVVDTSKPPSGQIEVRS